MNSDIDISKIREMNGGLLLVLQQLLEHGSVTRTATALSLGQSTISHSLSRLRDLFQDPLFVRKPHGLEPTQRAIRLQPQVEQLLELTRHALDIGRYFDPTSSTRMFSLSAPEFVAATAATKLLGQFQAQAPKAGIRFSHLPEADVFEQLRRGELDVAVGRFEQAPIGVALTPLYQDEFCLACRRGHPIAKGRITQRKYSSAHHIWADSPSETTAEDSEFDFSTLHGSVVPSWQTALFIAAQSDYVATCPKRFAESQAAMLNLEVLKPPMVAPIKILLACRADLQDRGTQWFVEQLRSVFGTSG